MRVGIDSLTRERRQRMQMLWCSQNESTKQRKPLVNTSVQRRIFKEFYTILYVAQVNLYAIKV